MAKVGEDDAAAAAAAASAKKLPLLAEEADPERTRNSPFTGGALAGVDPISSAVQKNMFFVILVMTAVVLVVLLFAGIVSHLFLFLLLLFVSL